jgi:hypothetical protein
VKVGKDDISAESVERFIELILPPHIGENMKFIERGVSAQWGNKELLRRTS